jgi:molecular chaperone HtpG
MPESQDQIYYICGPNAASLARNPNLEIFRKRKLEVLFLTDPVDEIALSQLGQFDGKQIVSVDSSELKVPEGTADDEAEPEQKPETSAGFDKLLSLFRDALQGKIADVKESNRLTDSPCCLVNKDGRMSTQLQKILSLQHEDFPMSEQILEIKPTSPLVQRLTTLAANQENEGFLKDCALNLLDQALLVEGIAPDGVGLAQRMLNMMQELAGGKSSILT